MNKKIFAKKEITTIVMATIEYMEAKNIYGDGYEDDIYLPKPINDKLTLFSNEEFDRFFKIINELSAEVIEYKSGELNELNRMHEEINFLADTMLEEYILE
ncbi:hypothetical protein SAMN02745163_03993 [Clostridium cavendishii DSM 21758]|uniref:Uncharacterized protein n=1 Tax=Clostridium cavendishii DSM 21758 TaxID=1121302 RepID=A0A1M6T9C9_9CLOT|nr:hypothetical protein [Clostridium cavendishii]SHK53573.1 hypothetical protein SAMN02745163_03993 [Clostridium cavendishii DSM 21758]